MTLTQIHALLAVLEYGGFTEASKRLYMTQSAVSQAISALEEELGVDILIRERRKEIELTAAGSRIVRHLRAIQRDVNAVKEIAEQEKRTRPVRYGLAVFPAPAPAFYPASFAILKAIIQM
ncbi:hypothetical protein RB531_3976 [Salmonella enterica subsp. enterica serovar Typhimurium]